MTEKEENNFIFRVIHGTVFQIARNKLRIKTLEGLLKDKKLIDSDELDKKWDSFLESDLSKVFKEIEEILGFENIKLVLKDDGSIDISGLPKE